MKLLSFVTVFCLIFSLYADKKQDIKLTSPDKKGGKSLMEALTLRKSQRSFDTEKELSEKQLSNLLYAANGVNRSNKKRTAPSASNWQGVDIYVAMEKGLYRYDAEKHLLEHVMEKDLRAVSGKQEFTDKAPVDLIYVADFSKISRDKKSKQFYSATDTGFISQNVYLYAASEGLATVVLGYVDKKALRKLMKLKKQQRIILTQPVGFPSSESSSKKNKKE